MKPSTKEKLDNLRHYVDGEINTWYERFMFVVVIVNIASLGVVTSKSITPTFKMVLTCIDQVSTLLFIAELLLKVIAYNRDFFGEKRIDDEGKEYFHINSELLYKKLILRENRGLENFSDMVYNTSIVNFGGIL